MTTPEEHTKNIEAAAAKPVTPPEVLERFKREHAPLALRVRDGNDKCMAAWVRIQDFEPEQFEASYQKIDAAVKKLQPLCLYLEVIEEVLEGKGKCLYMMSGKKTRQCKCFEKSPKGQRVETFCFVCPSATAHWRDEWSDFNQAIMFGKDEKPANPGV